MIEPTPRPRLDNSSDLEEYTLVENTLEESTQTKKDILLNQCVPQRGLFTEEARLKRLNFLIDKTGCKLDSLQEMKISCGELKGNIENVIGAVEIPVGIGGPLWIQGAKWNENIYIPLATTEGALLSSVNRGARALNMSGGVTARVLRRRMSRSPIFDCGSMLEALEFKSWLQKNFHYLQKKITEYSNYAKLMDLEFRHGGPCLHVVFLYETGDASGQNMTTICTWQACQWIQARYQIETGRKFKDFMLEANMSTDKKASYHSILQGRGREVIAEVLIPEKIIKRVFRTTPELMVKMLQQAQAAQMFSGTQSFNINIANVIAGVFTATGQDIACVHESSVGQFHLELRGGDIYASMHLPSLVVGTVGGGVGLPIQQQMLKLMGCYGKGGADRLAEIIASYCLALDLSTATSLLNGSFVDAHERWGRNRNKDWLKKSEINVDFFTKLISSDSSQETTSQKRKIKRVTNLETINGESLVIDLSTQVTNRLCGLWMYGVEYEDNYLEEIFFVKSKVKDEELIKATEMMAYLCDKNLGQRIEEFRSYNFFNKSHIKELKLASYKNTALDKIRPKTLGVYLEENREIYILAQEMLIETELLDCVDQRSSWTKNHLKAAVSGISGVHGEFINNTDDSTDNLREQNWFGVLPSLKIMEEMKPLWISLISYMEEEFCDWLSPQMAKKHKTIAETVGDWWGKIESMPKTLIHHDFNSRNITFRRKENNPKENSHEENNSEKNNHLQLIAYDWELATIHLPQRDIAELLSFTLEENFDADIVNELFECHRQNVEKISGQSFCPQQWRKGYLYALYDFLIYRLSLYSIVHRYKPCSFLEPTYRTTMKLINFLELEEK